MGIFKLTAHSSEKKYVYCNNLTASFGNHVQITLFAFFTWQYPAVSNLRAFNVLDAFSGQVISAGLSDRSSRINPSVWMRRTLSLYGSNNSEVVLRPLASRNGAILGYSPLKGLPGFVNWNRHWSDPTGMMELSVWPSGNLNGSV
ncbi:unnamed protein product [Rhizophagus irregularis]|nr:unnamed protein product [Rhizophagus irregularis]